MLKGRTGVPLTKELFSVQQERGALLPHRQSVVARLGALCSPFARRCLGDWKRAGFLVRGAGGARRHSPAFPAKDGAKPAASRSRVPCLESLRPLGSGARSLSRDVGRRRAVEERDVNISVSSPQFENSKGSFSLSGSRKLYFDTHAFVCLLEKNGFTTQQAEVIVSALMNIMKSNMDVIYKDMVTKMQQEIALQQIMSHIGVVKKDMIILEKSEFSALRAVNEKLKLELQQLKKQVMDETSKVRTDSKLDFNLEKSRVKELYSLNERKLLKMRTEIVELHAQQDRALTQTDRKIDTEVAGLKTMLESHKLDNIKYLAGSVFTCLTVALGFYRLWI
ncbi:mitochondrial calcium uniporter regulator 1 isoform X1 [Pogona vitticeps]|uniref:Mitochondrial calcium uniporter regulator 1 isoform X1 n=1 Tax=Pogona vitticeps TaxID=103695 RepID=A0A6J0U0U5_9SAUR|nr:mitochondrial calcium uniporter regulator 1 [Pogona vitticeps]